MDDFSDILPSGGIVAGLAASTKKQLFQQLGSIAGDVIGVDPKLVVDRLGDRERLGSTGFGGGIAIPHAKIDGLPRVVGLFARLSAPIEFAAIDALPIDLVFALLSPPDAGVDHLKALARVSRRMRDRDFVAKLRGAGSADALFALFASGESRDAA